MKLCTTPLPYMTTFRKASLDMSDLYKVAGVQMDIAFADVSENLQRMSVRLDQAASQNAQLVVFPECAATGYCFESLEEAMPVAEEIPGPITEHMAEACRRLNVFAVFGMLEKDTSGDEERLFNAAVLVGPAGVVGVYRKVHLPFLGIDRFVTPGDRPFAVHSAGQARVGMNICYDGSFPEAARVMALAGADLIVLPTNWPPGSESTADYVINARAVENNVYYMAVNRVGVERGFRFIGKSKICSTNGQPLDGAEHENETILYAEIDLARARNKHLVRVPNEHEIDRFKDRRPEMYKPISEPIKEPTASQ